MAVGARDIPVTREEVYTWLEAYDGKLNELRAYLQAKIDEKDLPDDRVDTADRTDVPQSELSVVDIIMADLSSYV